MAKTKKKKSKKSCEGLNAKGRLKSGFRWTKGASCPKKAKAKSKTKAKKGPARHKAFSLVRDYEAFKAKQHDTRRQEERKARPDDFDFSALGRASRRRWR